MRPFSFALTLGAVAALRVAPLRMSATATEAAAKAKWLAKTAKPTFTGKVVATNAIAPPAPQAAAYAYEDRVLGRTHGGPTAYERSMLHPSTHWGVVATAGVVPAPATPTIPSFTAPAAAQEAQQAAAAYEDRVLGRAHGSRTAYEYGIEHPSTQWGVGWR